MAIPSLETLVAELAGSGVTLRVEGERLRYTAPQGALTPLVLSHLQARKTELIAWLKNGQVLKDAVRTCPPSFSQRRFWTLQKLNPSESFYNVPFVFRLQGRVDAAILRESFDAIVRRHEILRTTLPEIDGEVTQLIAPFGGPSFSFISLRDLPPHQRAEQAASLPLAEIHRPFDFAREPGLRVLLLEVENDDYIFQLVFHNTVFDQSSLMILLDELSLHYNALVTGSPISLPEPAQYSDYVRWRDSFLSAGMPERLSYWREWFALGGPPPCAWTPPKPKPVTPSFHSHVSWQRYSPELTKKLKLLSQRNGATLYITLVAAYFVILRRYTGCSDITIGTTYSNRHHWQFASLIGATIDVPALRVDMTDDPDTSALLARVRSVITAALTYQDAPLEQIAPYLQLANKPEGPLFRSVIAFFGETPHGRLRLAGVTVTFLEEIINEVSRPDLYLVLWENQTGAGDVLTGYWMHKQDVFTLETAHRMNREFEELLTSLTLGDLGQSDQSLSS